VRNARRRDAPSDASFSWGRWLVSLIASALGLGLGLFVGLYGGNALDAGAGYPLGKTQGFMSFGLLTLASLVGGTGLGAVFGALGGHRMLEGEGGFGTALVAVLLGMGGVALAGMDNKTLVLPALALLPLFAATGLELASNDG